MRAALVTVALILALPASAAARDFPKDFQWGVATAGFQSEMGQGDWVDRSSDWWAWAHDPRNIERGVVSGDLPENGPGFFERYKHDVDLAANRLHMKAFRLSLEWSRIFPRSTRGLHGVRQLDEAADQDALRRYRAILKRIRARGMRPWVTLNHFTLPHFVHHPLAMRGAFAGRGAEAPPPKGLGRGWLDRGTVSEFGKYADYVSLKLGDLVDDWMTINEPVVLTANGYVNLPGVASGFPPGATNFPAAKAVLLNLMDANAVAYRAVKAHDPGARVGVVQNMVAFTPVDPGSALDVRGTRHADYIFNRLFLDGVVKGYRDTNVDGKVAPSERHPDLAGRADFIGVNYYFRGRVSGLQQSISQSIPILDFLPSTTYRSPADPGAPECPTTCSGDHGSEIYPQGFRRVLAEAGSYRLPVVATENGIGTSNDAQRRAYLTSHLRAMRAAMRAKEADVRGFFEWSLTDNFEWNLGFDQHFGLYGFDPRTLARRERGSARLYGEIARTGELPD
ncbi:MAG TPA: glycoside hydrolase family 1 protein [Thermoleophilaceae bacterium]|nr:glycoside hydrolase family 1 protein [Thermoleophilaceae bacterium]